MNITSVEPYSNYVDPLLTVLSPHIATAAWVNANVNLLISPCPWESSRGANESGGAFGSSGAAGDARVLLCKITNVDTHTHRTNINTLERALARSLLAQSESRSNGRTCHAIAHPAFFFQRAPFCLIWLLVFVFLLCARLTDLIRPKAKYLPPPICQFLVGSVCMRCRRPGFL